MDKTIHGIIMAIRGEVINMKEFEKLNLIQQRKMAIEELVEYYSELRKFEYHQGKELQYIELRKKINLLINFILKIDQLFSKEKITIIGDKHNKESNNPRIYACTHIGGNDIQRTLQVIKEPAYLMLGDPGILYKKIIYKGLEMNGVIPLETTDKEDRKIAYSRAIELLNKGGNLLIYPEGAWNVSPNLLVMKIFTGTVRMAKETGAEIIPIAMEQYGDNFYFNIGSNYTIPVDSSKSDKELTDELRDKLVTLKWEIMEQQPTLSREDISHNYLEEFQSGIVEKCNYGYGFSLQDALDESYHDKTISTYVDVFSFLEDIEITPKKASLEKERQKHQKIKKLRKTVI